MLLQVAALRRMRTLLARLGRAWLTGMIDAWRIRAIVGPLWRRAPSEMGLSDPDTVFLLGKRDYVQARRKLCINPELPAPIFGKRDYVQARRRKLGAVRLMRQARSHLFRNATEMLLQRWRSNRARGSQQAQARKIQGALEDKITQVREALAGYI
jgi:hypothetical protein